MQNKSLATAVKGSLKLFDLMIDVSRCIKRRTRCWFQTVSAANNRTRATTS